MNDESWPSGSVSVTVAWPTLSFQSVASTVTAIGPEKVSVLNWKLKLPSVPMPDGGMSPSSSSPSAPVTVHAMPFSRPSESIAVPCTVTVWV